jgi:amidase
VPAGPSFDNHLMGLATELVLARSVRDVATVFQAVCGSARLAADDGRGMQPRVALAIPDRVGPEQARAARNAAAVLEAAGCRMHERESPDDLGAEAARLARVVLTAALAESLKTLGPEDGEVSPLVAAVAAEGRHMPATDLFAAARDLARLGYECRRLFEDADMVLSPVLSGAPPMVGHFDAGSNDPAARFAAMEALAPNAVLANAAGIPALALPFGRDLDGLPLGVQLMAPAGADLALLKWGSRLEAGSPTLPFPYPIAGLT